jgi:hypothetical protein
MYISECAFRLALLLAITTLSTIANGRLQVNVLCSYFLYKALQKTKMIQKFSTIVDTSTKSPRGITRIVYALSERLQYQYFSLNRFDK